MHQYFSDEQIDKFLGAYLARYPDALERMYFVMKHPFRKNDELNSRRWREIVEIADTLDFFKEYEQSLNLKPDNITGRNYDAYHHISRDVAHRVADMLGPIGSYDIEE